MKPLKHEQLREFAPDHEKTWHARQLVSEVCARRPWYVPLSHAEQSADPFAGLYAPYPQAWHALPSGPVKPATQRQLVSEGLAAGEKAFAGQGMQGPEPLAAL